MPLFDASSSNTFSGNKFNIVLSCAHTSNGIVVLESKSLQNNFQCIAPNLTNSTHKFQLTRNNTDSLIYEKPSHFDHSLKRITLAAKCRNKGTQTLPEDIFSSKQGMIDKCKSFSRTEKINFIIESLNCLFSKIFNSQMCY